MRNTTKHGYIKTLLLSGFILVGVSCSRIQHKQSDSSVNPAFFLSEINIAALHDGYKNGKFTITEVVQAYLNRIDAIDKNGPQLNSVIQLNPEALDIAAGLDQELREGHLRGPLHGIPVLIKDNIDTRDQMPTTAGSRALAQSFPLKDSYIVQKLRQAGAVILGKTNLSEWANFRGELSISGWSGLGGQTRNPYDPDRNPCGSSSGSGVAVSANLCVIAIGTETDGSIVCPSHINGIVGIKPTVGLLSRNGIIPISWTQDTPGPMARNVTDAAICLGVLTGVDSADSKTLAGSAHMLTDYTQFLKSDGLKGKRLGIYKESLGVNYKVDSLFRKAVADLEKQGATVVEVDQISPPETDALSFNIMLFEYKDGLNRYFASLGPGAKIKNIDDLIAFNKNDSIELKYFNQHYLEMAAAKGDLQSPEYQHDLSAMLANRREKGIDRVMAELNLDAIIAPTGSPAWVTDPINGDAYQLGTSSPAAQAGYPNITVPMGFIEGLPAGISFFGKAWSEPTLIEIAFAYEQATHHRKAPVLKK